MAHYVDGFVLPIHKSKIDAYREIAEKACAVWMEHGALEYRECIGDDLEVKDTVSFLQIAGAKPEETVVFAWITYKSREHRDEVNAKVMADPRMSCMGEKHEMPFDCSRIAYSGFKTIVES